MGRETQIRPMTSTSEPAHQQASPSPGTPKDEVAVADPAPLDLAASQVEGAGAPGTGANTGSDLAASVVADGANAVPGVTSARRVLRAGLDGEALQMAVRFDRELDAAEWFEQLVQRG